MSRIRLSKVGLLVFAIVAAGGLFLSGCKRSNPDEFHKLLNVGKAHIENREASKAIEVLTRAVAMEPDSGPALRNLARAQIIDRKYEAALVSLQRVESNTATVQYLSGLAYFHLGQFDKARASLEAVVRLDAQTAAVRFQLARSYQALGEHEKAKVQLRETTRLDPLHASAQYSLATYARKDGDREEFERRNFEFMRLRKVFGNETRSADALELCRHTVPESAPPAGKTVRPESPELDVRFAADTSNLLGNLVDSDVSSIVILNQDPAGQYTLALVTSDGVLQTAKRSENGPFQRVWTSEPIQSIGRMMRIVVCDFHNVVPEGVKYDPKVHALSDALLIGSDGLRLMRQRSDKSFEDVTQASGLAGEKAQVARWIDYEHDGDLDLILADTRQLALWQNNGDGTFAQVLEQVGLKNIEGVVDVAVGDLDANVGIDFVLAMGKSESRVIENKRAGRFEPMPEPPGPWPAAERILINDVNNDGHLDTILIGNESIVVMRGGPDGGRDVIGKVDPLADAALFDFDNDGWLDLVATGADPVDQSKGFVQVWRNLGDGKWADVSQVLGLSSSSVPPLLQLIAADLDDDGDTDLLLLSRNGTLHLLTNEGSHSQGQWKVHLVPTKGNPSAIGVQVEFRDAGFLLSRAVTGLPVEIGVGDHRHFDSIRTVWTNGVVDNLINVTVTALPLEIVEKNVPTGSCPFLYAWDGERFRFITDILGNAPIGLSLTRDVLLPADPDEFVRIGDADEFPMVDGELILELTDEFREVFYLDRVKVVAAEHDSDVEIHASDKIMAPPFPPSELWALRPANALSSAMGSDGRDRTADVMTIDQQFAPPGLLLKSPYRGMCHPMSLTLDFGALESGRPLVLALTGWLQYGDASTNVGMSQNSKLEVIPPKLEAKTADGDWQPLDVVVGMPAGKTKTILCDLTGKLPEHTQSLRLTTTFEIRWDRIALFEKVDRSAVTFHELPLGHADLYHRGYSRIEQWKPGHPHTPKYEQVSMTPPWRTTPQGWCTRFGDVLPLIDSQDNKLAILNGGDALTLRFRADELPPVSVGRKRTLFFYSVGWDKDQDHNVVTGDSVEPLPSWNATISTMPADSDMEDWRLEYNTRFVPGRIPAPRSAERKDTSTSNGL